MIDIYKQIDIKYIDRHIYIHRHRQINIQIDIHAYIHAYRHAGRLAVTLTYRRRDRQAYIYTYI